MVSKNPNPPEGFYLDPTVMALPGMPPFASVSAAAAAAVSASNSSDDAAKKIRKPYTITKSRENWTEPEHDKFLEALQLFDRDWKKIEAFVGSKTVIQIRSHAQKYFLKVQKSGASEHLPPPRPKRKAAHPYPQKASRNAPVLPQVSGSFQSSSSLLEPGYILKNDSPAMLKIPMNTVVSSWSNNTLQTVNLSPVTKVNNPCSSGESTPKVRPAVESHGQGPHQGNKIHPLRVLPDFTQVYGFIGSVFDPNATEHLQKLKKMDRIDVETVLLLMRNLSINLTSPDFEDHRKLLSSYEVEPERNNYQCG
ncbi:protein REVEILLE 6 [Vigna radiata var. radiata]|uniref:Protein REVEILLE 6 n=1 Tax=Vigna radiata var. radiata TaxID=3916 RepID=A0A1S3UAR9_VIGRR|nr:protein REVEILLE 6 [Vigna radiata var. radiata]